MTSGEQELVPVPRHLPTGHRHPQLHFMGVSLPTKHKAIWVNTYRTVENMANSDKRK